MALNNFKCNYLTPLHFKGLKCTKFNFDWGSTTDRDVSPWALTSDFLSWPWPCTMPWTTRTPLCRIEPSADSAVQTVNRRRSSVSGRSSTVLEQASWQSHVSKWPIMCRVGRQTLHTHSLTHVAANSLSAFQQQLKHTLFQQSFSDIIMWHFLTVTPIVVLAVASLLRPL